MDKTNIESRLSCYEKYNGRMNWLANMIIKYINYMSTLQ